MQPDCEGCHSEEERRRQDAGGGWRRPLKRPSPRRQPVHGYPRQHRERHPRGVVVLRVQGLAGISVQRHLADKCSQENQSDVRSRCHVLCPSCPQHLPRLPRGDADARPHQHVREPRHGGCHLQSVALRGARTEEVLQLARTQDAAAKHGKEPAAQAGRRAGRRARARRLSPRQIEPVGQGRHSHRGHDACHAGAFGPERTPPDQHHVNSEREDQREATQMDERDGRHRGQ